MKRYLNAQWTIVLVNSRSSRKRHDHPKTSGKTELSENDRNSKDLYPFHDHGQTLWSNVNDFQS
jgi:hypothetical protein